MNNFVAIVPELFLLTMACVVLVVDVFLPEAYRAVSYQLALMTLLVTGGLAVAGYPAEPLVVFSGAVVVDGMGAVLKAFIAGTAFFAFVYSKGYLQERSLFKGEYYVLGLFAVLGMMVMVSAHSLLTVYLGLELLSLCLYAMVAMHRDSSVASEAAMKYFVLGALASGMLLYGISMIYGGTGSIDLGEIARVVEGGQVKDRTVLVFGLVFLVVGLAFKLGAVPFHMWLPDVYHGAPTPVTLFIGSAPKMAAFALVIRVLAEGLGGLQADWQAMLVILAVLSMAVGNVIAIAQTNLKRMFAYSTISHVGFLILGVLAGTAAGYAASMFYAIAYAIMSLGGFGMIVLLSRAGFESDRLDDLKGLNERSPWFAFVMMVFLFSMAGVPPFVGFWAKWSVLREVVAADLVWVAVVAVVFSIIGAFYYLRAVKLMYFDKPEDTTPITAGGDLQAAVSVNGIAVLGLGLFPGALLTLCVAAFAGG